MLFFEQAASKVTHEVTLAPYKKLEKALDDFQGFVCVLGVTQIGGFRKPSKTTLCFG